MHGHGHVKPRPDGLKARCGGPAMCEDCRREAADEKQLQADWAEVRRQQEADADRLKPIQYPGIGIM